TDRAEGDCWRFVAPPAFLGNHEAALGRTLRFDLRAPGDERCVSPFVQLSGDGLTLNFTPDDLIGTAAWRTHALPLTASPAWTRLSDGGVATAEEFQRVLASVTSFSILGEFENGNDTAWLDNVALGSCE